MPENPLENEGSFFFELCVKVEEKNEGRKKKKLVAGMDCVGDSGLFLMGGTVPIVGAKSD